MANGVDDLALNGCPAGQNWLGEAPTLLGEFQNLPRCGSEFCGEMVSRFFRDGKSGRELFPKITVKSLSAVEHMRPGGVLGYRYTESLLRGVDGVLSHRAQFSSYLRPRLR